MNNTKSTNVTVALDEDTVAIFKEASEIVEKAGIRVPTSQLVQTHAERRKSASQPRKVAQRFLKSIIQQIGGFRDNVLEDEDDSVPELKPTTAKV